MSDPVRQILAAISIIAASFLLVGLAATAGLDRTQSEHLHADLSSVIEADYTANPGGATLAPLSERIVDAVRVDETKLQETTPDVQIVPICHLPTSRITEDYSELSGGAPLAPHAQEPSRTDSLAPTATPTPAPTHPPERCLLRRGCPAPTPTPTETPEDASEDVTPMEVTR